MAIKVKDLFYRWIESKNTLTQCQKDFDELKDIEYYKPSGMGPVYAEDIERYLEMHEKLEKTHSIKAREDEKFNIIIGELRGLFAVSENRPIITQMDINRHTYLMKGEFIDNEFTLKSI